MKLRLVPGLSALFLSLVAVAPTSATAQQTPSFSFGAAGDFDFGARFKATAAAVKAQDPDFLIALGDLSYSSKEKSGASTGRRQSNTTRLF